MHSSQTVTKKREKKREMPRDGIAIGTVREGCDIRVG